MIPSQTLHLYTRAGTKQQEKRTYCTNTESPTRTNKHFKHSTNLQKKQASTSNNTPQTFLI